MTEPSETLTPRTTKEQYWVDNGFGDKVWVVRADFAIELENESARLREEVERLNVEIDNIKQVEFPKRVENVSNGWRKKLEAAEAALASERAAHAETTRAHHEALDAFATAQGDAFKERAAREKVERDLAEAREALRPFAKYACDVPCGYCHNCRARAFLSGRRDEGDV